MMMTMMTMMMMHACMHANRANHAPPGQVSEDEALGISTMYEALLGAVGGEVGSRSIAGTAFRSTMKAGQHRNQ